MSNVQCAIRIVPGDCTLLIAHCLLLIGALLPAASFGQTMWLGTNRVNAGKIVEFRVPPNARARMEASPRQLRIDFVTGAVAVPNGFNLIKPRPMLVVSVPSGG